MKLERYQGNPILSPNSQNHWESLVTTNPGTWYDPESRQVIMLYRAAGDDDEHVIRLGLAVSDNGYDFKRVSDEPVFVPSANGFDAGCVEDPRIVKFGQYYYVTYATRHYHPGKYWLKGGPASNSECPEHFPYALRKNATATGLAITKDFKNWIRAGRMTSPIVDDRDVIIFPEKIRGQYVLLHRPMEWTGSRYGTDEPAMWISFSQDLLHWPKSTLLAKAAMDWERKIGGNTVPIKTPHGWLTLYHAVGDDGFYRLGAMLLDLEEPANVTHRAKQCLLEPLEDYELQGCYEGPGVVFPCGSVVIDKKLFVYYGAADKYIGLATCQMDELLDYLLQCTV